MDVVKGIQHVHGSALYGRIMQSISVIQRSIDLYGTTGLALSLNGGKDSTVLLHLIRAALELRRQEGSGDEKEGGLGGMVTFFFDKADDFPQVVQFTKEMDALYSLDMRIYTSDFFTGLKELLEDTDVKGIFLGTRRGDPNAGDQETFSPSSAGWPVFMRINPIMEWSYHDVWEFLIMCHLPYCSLYDEGYTSLGSVESTLPNSALSRHDGKYSPAHMLQDPRLERAGRTSRSVTRADSLIGSKKGTTIMTAGLAIIGDEILAAKVDDVNMKFLCKSLRSIGWLVTHVHFIRDDIDDIADAVSSLSSKCDAVLSCGGLGPTLDDVTMKAVAKAIGRKIVTSASLEKKIKAHFGDHVTKFHLKMAEVPDGPETILIDYMLRDGRPSPYPLVRCRNIYILPGVPSIVEQKWSAVRDDLADLHSTSCHRSDSQQSFDSLPSPEIPFSTVVIRLKIEDEAMVSQPMELIEQEYSEHVSIGCYPLSNQSDSCTVAMSLEGKDRAKVDQAQRHLMSLLDPATVSSIHRQGEAIHSPSDAPTLGE
ncbi:hypothetical protein M9434_005547 [Picochlorum sp. BPE23]|nr:hypothetical protein M9434_005547 [Picochlorum sp. BPE23]